MTKDVRAGCLDLLPMLFQALVDCEQQMALYRVLTPATDAAWHEHTIHILKAWDSVAALAAAYAATCPELGARAEREKYATLPREEGAERAR